MPFDKTFSPFPVAPPAGTMTSFHNALPEGHRVDAWRIDRVVATSATAVVYAATNVQLGTVVALKEYMPARLARREEGGSVVPIDAPAFDRGLNAFVATARKLARCRQPSLVSVLGFSLAHGTAYQAMPWIAGTSLRDLRAAMPGPPDEIALRALLDDLLDALAAIHATGSIHGDVHPGKVLLQRDDRAVLLGPGSLAREGSPVEPGDFVAPESSAEVGGSAPGPWSDLYAVAAVARFCIAGDARSADVPPAGYSANLLSAIERALSKEAEARPQSVAAFRAELVVPPPAAIASAPEPVESTIELDAERARIKRLVDSISFEEDAEELPRTEGMSSRSTSATGSVSRPGGGPRAVPTPALARAPRRAAAALIAGVAVLAALAVWSVVRQPNSGSAAPLAQRVATPGGLSSAPPVSAMASTPASSARPSVEDSLAAAAAVLGASNVPPMPRPVASGSATLAFEAPAPAPTPTPTPAPTPTPTAAGEPVATVPSAGRSANVARVSPTPVSRASAPSAAKPRPVTRAATTTAATRKPAVSPRSSCSGRNDFALYRCMTAQCAQPRWMAHPQCVRLRKTDRVDG